MKIGDKGLQVMELQRFLNSQGASPRLLIDGDFGNLTRNAVIEYQRKNGLPITGEMELQSNPTQGKIIEHFLPSNEYVNSKSTKKGVCLHHTASNGNPYNVPRVWDGDNRGRVSTHFVVGADGTILQCIPLENWAYHIAMGRMGYDAAHNNKINSQYIGIEICNWGYLEPDGKGNFKNYTGGIVPIDEVVKLDKPFRHYQYWHKYTEQQVASVKWLLGYLQGVFGFKYETEKDIPYNEWWLELSFAALRGERVLTTHTNFEVGKWDCSPQPNFFKMLP